MRTKHVAAVILAVAFLLVPAGWYGVHRWSVRRSHSAAQEAAVEARTTQQLDPIVGTFRKIIVLTDDLDSLDSGARDRVLTAGQVLFQENHERLSTLSASLSDELSRPDSPPLAKFLERVESNPDYRDADKLVFRDVFEDLATTAAQIKSPAPLQKRLADDLAALGEIQALYEKEIGTAFGSLRTRGMPVHREAWERYLAFVKQKYQREQILQETEKILPAPESRGGGKKNASGQIQGTELPPRTLLLTFDDGPHPRYTDQVLAILKKYDIQAVFFEVGRNLGTVGPADQIRLAPTAAVSYRVMESGSSLGNHSFSHPVLSKLEPPAYTEEIDSTNKLLKYILKTNPVLFRPPYGASNDGVLAVVQSEQLKSMIWNIDSMDWADPVPSSVIARVLSEVDRAGRGIILLHDIHKRTVELLPQLIETLQGQGYRFASWSGVGFSAAPTRGTQPAPAAAPVQAPYRESWAAIIGIDDYQNWPKLRYAANDARGVRDLLIQTYGFKPENIFLLLNADATRQSILSLLGDKLGNGDMVKREDRVLVFFAGHGATRKLPSGRDLGYIIPVDAGLGSYEGQAISMTNFQDISEAIPAKHVLFIMDSCYSGLALTRGGPAAFSQNYLQEISKREARQMFTAGGADQEVADTGPNGHSVFTWTLLQALDGRADLNGDGVITATELAAYAAPAVSALSHQTPAFGSLSGSEGGDFIFELKHESEFLNSASNQLGDDGIQLNAEIEDLRAKNVAETKQNEELRRELAAAQAVIARTKQPEKPARTGPDRALALNDEGMRLYKEKKYAEAANKFTEAAGLDPTRALMANNAGFALFQLGEYEQAIHWLQQAIAIDPNRAIAYANLGDACVKAGHNAQAKQAYEKFLELAPAAKSAAYVKDKLKSLE
jgi:peptidoglycan/xylan/chitin deacetylase (PgdA/CDA1 family)/tetratricopeptide (TPR) repeat protein